MKKIIFATMLICLNNTMAKTWLEILNEKEILFKNINAYKLICEQHHSFINNNAPVIANPIIKNIAINENNENLVDIRKIDNHRIKMLPDSPEQKSFAAAIYNSGLPSAPKIRYDIYKKLEIMLNYLDELAPLFHYKPGTISIKVFEGLRDLKTQEILFKNKFNELKVLNPTKSDEEIELETSKWVSPFKNNVPVHSTGAAIDIRLWNDETSDFIDLGKFGVIWGTNQEAQTFSENLSDSQKINRLYLLLAANQTGLINYVYEWWHFSAGDRYAIYWQQKDINKRIAIYGPIS